MKLEKNINHLSKNCPRETIMGGINFINHEPMVLGYEICQRIL